MKLLLWNILQYACLRCQGIIISLWIGTSPQPSIISFERSSWDMSRLHLSDLRPPQYCSWEQIRHTSWVWHFIPVFTTGFIYPRWLFRISSINNESNRKMQKKQGHPSQKKMPSCIYPSWSKTSQLLSLVGSQPSHFQVKKVTLVKVYPNAPNATRIST